MSLLQEVLSRHLPQEWECGDYLSEPYELFELGRYDSEYQRLAGHFGRAGIAIMKMERVQNPYTLGRFILRKEQLQCRGISVNERKGFHPVYVDDIETALRYNLDVRRYENPVAIDSRKPIFYTNPEEAEDMFPDYSEDKAIVVVDIMNMTTHGHTTTSDADYNIKYVVYIE